MLTTTQCLLTALVIVILIVVVVWIHRYQTRVKRHMAEADHLYAMVREMHTKIMRN